MHICFADIVLLFTQYNHRGFILAVQLQYYLLTKYVNVCKKFLQQCSCLALSITDKIYYFLLEKYLTKAVTNNKPYFLTCATLILNLLKIGNKIFAKIAYYLTSTTLLCHLKLTKVINMSFSYEVQRTGNE